MTYLMRYRVDSGEGEAHRVLAEIKEKWGNKAKEAGQIENAIKYYTHAIGH